MPLPLVILALLALNAWVQSRTRWQWKLQLITLEFGHWLALCAAVLAVAAMVQSAKASAWMVAAYAGLAWFFLIPALQAWRIARQKQLAFSWLGLWVPRNSGQYRVKRERRTYWREGDVALDVVIHRPETAEGALPCLLIAHTGGWDSGDPGEFRFANAVLASHGYVVCNFGYRLAPRHTWPAQAEDTRRALAWVREQAQELGLDADRVVLMGRSAGAQIAAACAYSMPELGLRACVSIYGPPNMYLARQWALPDDILESLTLVRQYMGGDPDEVPEAYRTASASEFAKQYALPTLLIHGTRDALVDIRHSRYFTELVGERSDYCFLELPWGTHGTDYFPSTPGGQLSISAILQLLKRTTV